MSDKIGYSENISQLLVEGFTEVELTNPETGEHKIVRISPKAPILFVVHIAGDVQTADIQCCSRCGQILIDMHGAMVLDTDAADVRSHFWTVGAHIATGLGGSVMMDHDARDSDEMACFPGIPKELTIKYAQ